jgi:hypothetical protein
MHDFFETGKGVASAMPQAAIKELSFRADFSRRGICFRPRSSQRYHSVQRCVVSFPKLPRLYPLEAQDLEAEYRRMADDAEHEREALEWCEGLIADATDISDSWVVS